jgi:hypothetical protein
MKKSCGAVHKHEYWLHLYVSVNATIYFSSVISFPLTTCFGPSRPSSGIIIIGAETCRERKWNDWRKINSCINGNIEEYATGCLNIILWILVLCCHNGFNCNRLNLISKITLWKAVFTYLMHHNFQTSLFWEIKCAHITQLNTAISLP